jgi:hypothetical protein
VCAAVVGFGTSVVRRGRGKGSSKRDEEDKALKAEPKDVVRQVDVRRRRVGFERGIGIGIVDARWDGEKEE